MTAAVTTTAGGASPAAAVGLAGSEARIDPGQARALVALGARIGGDLGARLRAARALEDDAVAVYGPRGPATGALDQLDGLLRRLVGHDEALAGLVARVEAADGPVEGTGVEPAAEPGPVGPASPWLDPATDSWVVNLTLGLTGRPFSLPFVRRVRSRGPDLLRVLGAAAEELDPIHQGRLLAHDPRGFAANWTRAAHAAAASLGELAALGLGGTGLLLPPLDALVAQSGSPRPGRELALQAVRAAQMLVVDPDTLAEAQLGWPALRDDPYRWLGHQAPLLLAELGAPERIATLLRPADRGARPIQGLAEAAAELGAEAAPVRRLPDLASQRLVEPEWGRAGPIVSTRAAPFEPPEGWVKDLNGAGTRVPGRDINCVDCTRAVEANWRGHSAVAAPIDEAKWPVRGTDPARLEQWSGGHLVDSTLEGIQAELSNLGSGSSAMIVAEWDSRGAHAFNAVNDRGVVKWVDAQTGEVSGWPPAYGDRIVRSRAIFVGPDGVAR